MNAIVRKHTVRLLQSIILSLGLLGILGLSHRVDPIRASAAPPLQSQSETSTPSVLQHPITAQVHDSLEVISSDANGIVLSYHPQGYTLRRSLDAEGNQCELFSLTDHYQAGNGGESQLPVLGTWVGIPQNADVKLRVIDVETETIQGLHQLCPAVDTVSPLPGDIVSEPSIPGLSYESPKPLRPTVLPGQASDHRFMEIGEPAMIRSQRVVDIRFYPISPLSVGNQFERVISLNVEISFTDQPTPIEPSTEKVSYGPYAEEPSYESALHDLLINYNSARYWRARPTQGLNSSTLSRSSESTLYKVMVDQDGIYEITPDQLTAVGVDTAGIDPRTFKTYLLGQQIAIQVLGQEDGQFNAGDRIRFYGEASDSRYTDTNVYWLEWGGANGIRMAVRDVAPKAGSTAPGSYTVTNRWDKNAVYISLAQDPWHASRVLAFGSPAYGTYTMTLTQAVSTPYIASLKALLYGYSPEHHTILYLNGQVMDDAYWSGERAYTVTTSFPSSNLVAGTNVLSLSLPSDLGPSITYDMVYPNWFDVTYRRKYVAENDSLVFASDITGTQTITVSGFTTGQIDLIDITDNITPSILSGFAVTASSGNPGTYDLGLTDSPAASDVRYLAQSQSQRRTVQVEPVTPSTLTDTTNGADYIIITHSDFYTASTMLANYHSAQGLRTAVIDVQDIYNEFGYGMPEPSAIRSFLSYAYDNWTAPASAYVVLMGDGNYDFRDYYGFGEPNFIPPYLDRVDPWMGETAADNRYVCVSGQDTLPDMHLGRLPVKSEQEAEALVLKIIAYNTSQSPQPWSKDVLFVADNPDSAGDFYQLSDAVADRDSPNVLPARQGVLQEQLHPGIRSAHCHPQRDQRRKVDR